MKKSIAIIIAIFIMTSSVFANITIGDKIGDVLSTDIKTLINGIEIESFNIKGRTAIYISDLKKFNIPVLWNNDERKVTVNINTSKNDLKSNELEAKELTYADSIKIKLPERLSTSNQILIVEQDDEMVEGLDIKTDNGIINLSKTYYLSLGESYTLKIIKNNQLYTQKIKIKDFIEKESFTEDTIRYFKSVIVPANPKKGFYFPYRLMFWGQNFGPHGGPISFEDTKPILYIESTNHSVDSSFETMMLQANDSVGSALSYDIMRDTDYNGFSMIGIFPRLTEEGGIYTHALDRQTVFGTKEWFNQFNRGNLYRIDKQFVAMHKDAKEQLKRLGKNTEKPYLTGFSASSDFASRINYLYPDLAKAVIINDAPTMPLTRHNGVELKFPLGIADIQEVTGKPFDKSKYIDTPQFWTTGTNDTNDGIYFVDGWGSYTLDEPEYHSNIDPNQEGADYREAFGDNILERKKYIRDLLIKEGFKNIEFHTYDVGHGITKQTLKDIESFIKKIENNH